MKECLAEIYLSKLLGGKTRKEAGVLSLSESLQHGNVDNVVVVLNKFFSLIDSDNYAINDSKTCTNYLQLILIGAEGCRTYCDSTKESKHKKIHVETDKVHWVFDVEFFSEENGLEENKDSSPNELKELLDYSSNLEDPSGRKMLYLWLVYSEKERKFISSEWLSEG